MSELLNDKLNTVVVTRYATDDAAPAYNVKPKLALVLSSCEAPSFGVVDAQGNHYNWRQDLTRSATTEEVETYWRDRAENAERLRDEALALASKTQERNSQLIERLNGCS